MTQRGLDRVREAPAPPEGLRAPHIKATEPGAQREAAKFAQFAAAKDPSPQNPAVP